MKDRRLTNPNPNKTFTLVFFDKRKRSIKGKTKKIIVLVAAARPRKTADQKIILLKRKNNDINRIDIGITSN